MRACDQLSKHNLRVHMPDNETLGAWFIFADPFYATHRASLFVTTTSSSADPSSHTPIDVDAHICTVLRTHPTVLSLHGNCAMRVLRQRANVLAPDYRGFGDSTGVPSEVGLTTDVLAAWDWLRTHGASPEDVHGRSNAVRQRTTGVGAGVWNRATKSARGRVAGTVQ